MRTSGRACREWITPAVLSLLIGFACVQVRAAEKRKANPSVPPVQETGFLNRTVQVQGVSYHFQIYLPEDFHRWQPGDKTDKPPMILFLHGRGERGSEGMWQTQVGLPQELRDHPERWPFVVVMPQCPLHHFWTDPDMLQMAMAALEQELREFRGDQDRIYLTGMSLGGYGAWELARQYPQHWAAIALVATGIFWSYAPDRWHEVSTLPAEYARRVGRTPVWLFHGTEDTVVVPRQSDVMFDALKAEQGHVRFWEYQGLHHDSWTRAYNEPELPRWLLSHRLSQDQRLGPLADKTVVPLHPAALKLPASLMDTYVGEYRDASNVLAATIQRQGEQLFLKNAQGDVMEIQAESVSTFFYPTGSATRLTFEHDAQGHVTGIFYRDDRREERWEKRK
jgi:pimeloyl-ACP methyl ester carboxylesterase